MSLGFGAGLMPAPAPEGFHVRSSHAYGAKGQRKPAGVLHAVDNEPTTLSTACGRSLHGLYFFGAAGWPPTDRRPCPACARAVA